MDSNKNLKSCPFCNGQARVDGTADTIKVVCNCGAEMKGATVSLYGYDRAEQITIEKWNKRAKRNGNK